MLDDGPGIQPVDVYSATGLPGADFRAMPYFPPYLADELLDRAVIHRGLCRVPAPREHFLSLAYHALYHKGGDSGIPSANDQRLRARARTTTMWKFFEIWPKTWESMLQSHLKGSTRVLIRTVGDRPMTC